MGKRVKEKYTTPFTPLIGGSRTKRYSSLVMGLVIELLSALLFIINTLLYPIQMMNKECRTRNQYPVSHAPNF
jgi:hypothetical protein